MNGTLIWSLSICGNEITMKQTTNKWTWWKLLCCQRNSLKRYWKLQYLLEKFSILILMIRYALQQNLTRAVNSPVAFKSSFTSAVVRSFSVLTCSILVTRVCSLAFVNVWSKKKSSILGVKFASLMPSHGRKIDCWPSLHACAESYHPVRPMSSKYGQLFRLFLNLSIYDDDYYFARPFFVSQQLLSWDPTQGLR